MAVKQKSRIGIGFAFLLLAVLACTLMLRANASSDRWSDHADVSWFDPLYVTYTIDTPAKLAGVSKLVNDGTAPDGSPIDGFNGRILEISQNLDLSAYTWVPVGTEDKPFKGTMIAKGGNTYEIGGMKLDGSAAYSGFVGYMEGATVGGFRFAASGSINFNTVTVSTYTYVGAAVGKMVSNSTVYDITNDIPIQVTTTLQQGGVGGIVGAGEGTVANSVNNGSVSLTGAEVYTGGIAGLADRTGLKIKKVTNNGAVTAQSSGVSDAYAGGITGYAVSSIRMDEENTPIGNSAAITAINGRNSYAGGILGKAGAEVVFSNTTSNTGPVAIQAPAAVGAYAGGLAGSIGTEQAAPFDIAFVNGNTITNNGGSNVYTGGIAGYTAGAFTWSKSFTNKMTLSVTGNDHVYTGGLIGYASGTSKWNSSAKNEGNITVAGALPQKPDDAYTGGLVGFAGDRLLLESTAANAYSNSGAITVTGGTGVYTGGIVSNKAYARSFGDSANVLSNGSLTVNGFRKIYTGGFIGMVAAEGSDRTVTGASFARTITVTAAASDTANSIRTGGIVGYLPNGAINNSSFKGNITSTGGGAETYTGGIAGYVDVGTLTGAISGNTASAFAAVTADGSLGGVAGYMNGTLFSATVKYVTLTAKTQDGLAGGVAGKARGTITGANIGDAGFADSTSVKIAAAVTGALDGNDRLTAGGIVGRNDGPISIVSSSVVKLGLLTETGRSGYNYGGVAGVLTSEAAIGQAGTPLLVTDLVIDIKAGSANVGGAVGVNESPAIHQEVRNVIFNIPASSVNAGGFAGINRAAIQDQAHTLFVQNITIAAQGADAHIGGLLGENYGTVPSAQADTLSVTADGANNRIGGMAGVNTGSLTDSLVTKLDIRTNGAGAEVGGISGRSEQTGPEPAKITQASVHPGDAPLLTASGANSRIGGIVGYANSTEVTYPLIDTEIPNFVIINVSGQSANVGGIAGRIQGGKILGDSIRTNIGSLLISTTANASGAYVGGVTGYLDEARLEKAVGNNLNLIVNGANTVAGGLAAYNRGTTTEAIILSNHIIDLNIKSQPSASASTIGGFVGVNDARQGDAAPDPVTGVSSIQNSRVVGTIQVFSPNTVTGGMAGENRSLIANNSIGDKNSVSSKGDGGTIGGLVGINRAAGTLYYTYTNADLWIEGAGTTAGGLTGVNEGRIISSYVDIDVTGHASGADGSPVYLGGLTGINTGTVNKSHTSSTVTANGSWTIVGGLAGEHAQGSITNSYAAKSVTANGSNSYAGGFLGRITNGTVSTVYSAGQVTAANGAYAGGFAGRYDNTSKELLYKTYYVKDEALNLNRDLPDFAEGDYLWLNVHGRLSTILSSTLQDRNVFPGLSGWDFGTVWKYGSPNAEYKYPELNRTANSGGDAGSGTDVNANINWYTRDKDAPFYELKTEAELAGLAAIVNGAVPGLPKYSFEGRTIRIANPIHIQSKQWVPIGNTEDNAFQGIFEGNDHLIDGLSIASDGDYSGLFGVIGEKAKVVHVKMEPLTVRGVSFTGALAGFNKGAVSHIGIKLTDGTAVQGGTAGGIIGKNMGAIDELTMTLDAGSRVEADGDDSIAGGMIGDNTGPVHSTTLHISSTGGTIGSSSARATLGGLIGKQAGDFIGLGVRADYNLDAAGTDQIIGGLIGRHVSGKTEDVVLTIGTGSLKATGAGSILGGLVGHSDSAHTMARVTVTADQDGAPITGISTVGGIIGAKTGKGNNTFDVVTVRTEKVRVSTPNESTDAVAGGIAGKLINAAVHDASFAATIRAAGDRVTAGGIAGLAQDSILYKLDAQPDIITTSRSGESAVGGVAGIISASDINQGFDFGNRIPFYKGVYNATVHTKPMEVHGADNGADLYAGGIAGRVSTASVYYSKVTSGLQADGGKITAVGGIAGYSDGIIVSTAVQSSITANNGMIYHVGGAVGLASGGEIHYTNIASPNEEQIRLGTTITKSEIMPATHAGGFVGRADRTKITNSSASIPLSINCDNQDNTIYAGGFAGLLGESLTGSGLIEHSYAKGSVDVNGITGAYAGGFAGSVDHFSITDSYAAGNVSNAGFDTRTGGFAAMVERMGTIKNASAIQEKVTDSGVNHATRAYTGGFAGYNNGALESIYANVAELSLSESTANAYLGALIGYNFRDGKVTQSSYMGTKNPVGYNSGVAPGIVKADLTGSLTYGDWNLEPDTHFLMDPVHPEVVIQTLQQLNGSVLLYNETGLAYYKLFNRTATETPNLNKFTLANDIDLEGKLWVPFASFTGEFNGGGFRIKGFNRLAAGYGASGFITENLGKVANVVFENAIVAGDSNTGIAAGINRAGGVIDGLTVSGNVKGSDSAGGVAGKNEGTITNIEIGTLTVEGAGTNTGGIAGENSGEISNVAFTDATGVNVTASTYTGLAAGSNRTNAVIRDLALRGTVQGADYTGGVAGINEGDISNVEILDLTLEGGNALGGVVGVNTGAIANASVKATILAAGNHVGGLAGSNAGRISRSHSSGAIRLSKPGMALIAGGIAGENTAAGEILESFSYTDIEAAAKEVQAGGIAGVSRGQIANSYNSGLVRAEGEEKAWAGGLVGYAVEGSIRYSLNYGEVIAGVSGDIKRAKTFFGGVAGQKENAVTLTNNAFNKQMLKTNTAYYDAAGARITGENAAAAGMLSSQLASGTLPPGFDASVWQAVNGYNPQLKALGGQAASKLSAAAVILDEHDLVSRITSGFQLTRDGAVAWTADPLKVSIDNVAGALKGTLKTEGSVQLTATVNGISRVVNLNVPSLKFHETAAKPAVVSGDKSFSAKVMVELSAEYGSIYYTLDGSQPDDHSKLYTGPIELTSTTTLKAIAIVDDMETSEILSGTWTKQTPFAGGFFLPPPPPKPELTANIGHKTVDIDGETPISVARNSKLSLNAPEGKTIYYTTDGSIPTKNSPVLKGDLLIKGNMTVKVITDQSDKVTTFHYEVDNAQYEMKKNADQVHYIAGYKDGTFKPDAAITRYELVDVLAPLLDMEDVTVGSELGDLKAGAEERVAFFESAGIIEGYPDGTFGGERGLTRAEFVALMTRVLKLDINDTGETLLTDVLGHWSEKYVNAFTAAGYIEGFPDGTFMPEEQITRAQAVVVINRIVGTKKRGGTSLYRDLDLSHWAYEDIAAAGK